MLLAPDTVVRFRRIEACELVFVSGKFTSLLVSPVCFVVFFTKVAPPTLVDWTTEERTREGPSEDKTPPASHPTIAEAASEILGVASSIII